MQQFHATEGEGFFIGNYYVAVATARGGALTAVVGTEVEDGRDDVLRLARLMQRKVDKRNERRHNTSKY